MSTTYTTNSDAETMAVAERLAKTLTHPQIIGLTSKLGGGKTIFTQGLGKALRIKGKITSPTFMLEKIYEIPKSKMKLYHYDLYRITPDANFISEILEGAKHNLVVIEWANKIDKYLPLNAIRINITAPTETQRIIKISHE